ncbi:MAG: hypothetical protein MUO75_04820 [Actinobacteria bacterium]|nr:hypothetical protein [Actinomycetota bacterium]
MKKLTISLALIPVMLLLSIVGASAFQRNPAPPRQEARSQRIQQIETIIARFEANKERHIAVYNRIKDRLKEAADSLQAKGYDLTNVRQDYSALDSKIVKFATDYATFISDLRAAESYVPLESQGQFLSALEVARAQLRVARADSLDIRNFYWTVVRPDVQALRNQKPTQSSST